MTRVSAGTRSTQERGSSGPAVRQEVPSRDVQLSYGAPRAAQTAAVGYAAAEESPRSLRLLEPLAVAGHGLSLAPATAAAGSGRHRRKDVSSRRARQAPSGLVRQHLTALTGLLVLASAAIAWYLLDLPLLPAIMVVVTAFNLMVSGLEARWRLYRWRTPEAAAQMAWPLPLAPSQESLTFSLIVPARHEADVIGDTLRRLLKQDHQAFEIIVSLCADDPATISVVRGVIAEFPHRAISLVTESYLSPSKPQQLNTALRSCAGDIVGVIDAEDDVAPGLLTHVEALFAESGAAVVQGGVQLMNLGRGLSQWFQVHNVLEYFFWFTSRMSYQANAGFVPLGGNTVFVHRNLLTAAEGWPLSLTEDCALGVLLATKFGAKVATAYSAELATREESPPSIFNKSLGSLFWQRDRWIRGFLAEFMDGKWLRMPTWRQRFMAGYILATPFFQAISFLLLPFAVVVAVAVRTPIAVTMLTFTPVLPIGLTLLSQLTGLRAFGQMYGQRPSCWHYASVLILAPAYQMLLASAAAVATYKYFSGDTTWYKTGRAGAHREEQPIAAEPALQGMSA